METVGAEKRDLDQGLAITPDFKGASSLSFFLQKMKYKFIYKKRFCYSHVGDFWTRKLQRAVSGKKEGGVGERVVCAVCRGR